MGAVKQTVVEMLLLGVLSTGLAFGVNAVRKDGRIKPTKDYFATGVSGVPGPVVNNSSGNLLTKPSSPAGEKGNGNRAKPRSPISGTSAASPAPTPKRVEHPFKEIDLDEALTVLKDPQTARGLNVFVDARKTDDFAEGHIPGAICCFPYEVEKCIDKVLKRTNGAEQVIVYCGGGDCDDSIYMCRELVNAGVPLDAIRLYAGGWKEWSERREPIESGAGE